MKNSIATGLTVLNLGLLVVLLSQALPAAGAAGLGENSPERAASAGQRGGSEVAPALRARSLEIVDERGRVRALLAVMPPAEVDGKQYPETVLLRLIDPQAGPVVKLTAAPNGSALMLSDEGDGGVMIRARGDGSFVRVTAIDGREAEPKPAAE